LALAANLKSLDSWRATFSFIYYLEAATKKNYILLCQARVHVLLGDVDAVNEIISKIVRKPVMTIWHKLALVLSVLLDGVRRLFRGNPYWARYRKRADLDRAIKQILSAMSRPGLLQLFRKCDAATQQVGQFCSFVRSVVVGWLRHAVPGPDRRCIDAAWLLPEFIRPVVRALPNIDCG
jgi:hypothetical protein